MKYFITFCLALFTSSNSYADIKEILYQKHLLKIHRSKEKSNATPGIFKQKLDHRDSIDTRTFSQRFWVDSSYAINVNSPVLLMICGESECSGDYLGGTIAQHAKNLNAHMVAVEHRYYGQSQPFNDLSTDNLKYLSIEQSIQDLVSFKIFADTDLNLKGKWIAIGGSYAGALAAYLRERAPEHFVGALASSGPVQADLNFDEYDHHVAKMAGPDCLKAIQTVVSQIEAMVQTPTEFAEAKANFNADPLNRVDDFLYLVADVGAAAVQYGMREEFCELVETKGFLGYGEAAKMVGQLFGNLVNLSAQAAEDISLAANGGSIGMRQWFYQSCTEFGFWQNAYPVASESARSSQINSNYHADLCKRLFQITQPAEIQRVNTEWYLPLLNGSINNIFFTNGTEDPWNNLSLMDEALTHLDFAIMEGAAHCDDLGPSKNPKVLDSQIKFLELAKNWLK